MQHLIEIGINEDVINEIKDNNNELVITDLNFNYKKVKEIMDIFKSLNINNIDDYLIYKTDIFYYKPDYIIEKFNKYEKEQLIDLLKEDINNIDEILN